MDLLPIINRESNPLPWSEGDNIPWHEPGFSSRMLFEHLSQDHNAASRRFEIIDEHVTWIHQKLLSREPARILDLGCGPGFYTNRLAKSGHICQGIDYSPASISYARHEAGLSALSSSYVLGDIRTANYGENFDLVLLIYGELNVFRPEDARLILKKANRALLDGGLLLLEVHQFEAIRQRGLAPPKWHTADGGLFSSGPHICLKESFWRPEETTATIWYYVLDVTADEVLRYGQSLLAYTDDQYHEILQEHGFGEVEHFPSLGGSQDDSSADFFVMVAHKSRSA